MVFQYYGLTGLQTQPVLRSCRVASPWRGYRWVGTIAQTIRKLHDVRFMFLSGADLQRLETADRRLRLPAEAGTRALCH
jgi:hypothetical protein